MSPEQSQNSTPRQIRNHPKPKLQAQGVEVALQDRRRHQVQVTHTWDDVSHESVDVAITALVALASVQSVAQAQQIFEQRLAYIAKRAGVS